MRSAARSATRQGDAMKRLLRFSLPIVIAGVLGPLIGGLAICLFAAGQYVVDKDPGPIADLFGIFPLYMIFAFVLGWPIAVLAGLLVSIWMIFRPPGIVAVVAATAAAVGVLWLAAAANLMGPLPNLAYGMLALTLGLSIVAAIVCWLLARPFAARIGP
jgi:hypothetical protein